MDVEAERRIFMRGPWRKGKRLKRLKLRDTSAKKDKIILQIPEASMAH